MEEVEAYVLRRHNTGAQYITMQPTLDLFEEEVQWPGTRVLKRCGEQEWLDLAGAWGDIAVALEVEP